MKGGSIDLPLADADDRSLGADHTDESIPQSRCSDILMNSRNRVMGRQEFRDLSDAQLHAIDDACAEFEQACRQGNDASIEEHCARVEPELQTHLFRELLTIELEIRQRQNEALDRTEYLERFTDRAIEIETAFAYVGGSTAGKKSLRTASLDDTNLAAQTRHQNDESRKRPDEPSRRIIDAYEVIDQIGKGGMGVVYRARDPRLKRLVAIKMMLGAEHSGDEERERFRLEAEAVARLRHPNIVQVFDVGEHDTFPYIALEFVEGPDLSSFVGGTPQPEQFAAELVARVASTMQYAHGQGVVHRDLKPANILLDESAVADASKSGVVKTDDPSAYAPTVAYRQDSQPDVQPTPSASDRPRSASSSVSGISGSWIQTPKPVSGRPEAVSNGLVPKVTDFGLAKQLDTRSDLTVSGAIVGTPQFMAPEQATASQHAVGPLADVYSLGAILYYMITGRAPFLGDSVVDTLMMVRDMEAPSPRQLVPELSRDIETICLKCLEKAPARRYASADELAEELHRYLRNEAILARPIGRIERTARWCRRNPLVALLLLMCTMLLVGGLAGVTWKWREASTNLLAANAAEAKASRSALEATQGRNAAIDAQRDQQRLSSRVVFRRGLELCAEGDVTEGIHWLANSLRIAPDEPQDRVWRETICTNLGGWYQHLRQMKARCRPDRGTQAVALSPNGKLVVAGTLGGIVYRFDAQTGQPIGEPYDFGLPKTGWSAVWSLAFHPDGRSFIAVAGIHDRGSESEPGIVQWFDSTSGEPIGDPVATTACAECVAVSADGSLVAVICGTHGPRHVELFRSSNREKIATLGEFEGRHGLPLFSSDNRWLLLHGGTGQPDDPFRLSVLDLETGDLVVDAVQRDDPSLVKISNDGLEVTTQNHSIHFEWDSMREVVPDRFGAALRTSLRIRQDMAAEAIVDAVETSLLPRPPLPLSSPESTLFRPRHRWWHTVAVSRLGDMVVVGAEHGVAQIIDVESGTLRARPLSHPGNILAVAIHPNATLCSTGVMDVRVWDAQTGELRLGPLEHANRVSTMEFSPDGTVLAAGDYASNVTLWDVETGKKIASLPQRDIVVSLKFSPDGTKLIAGTASDWNQDPQARLWNLTTMQPIGDPIRRDGYVRIVDFSSDGRLAMVASSDRTLQILSAETGRPVSSLIPYSGQESAAVLTPDGTRVLTGSETGDVRGWHAESGDPVAGAVAAGPALVTALACSSDGRRFVAGYVDGTSQLFDVRTFQPIGPPARQGWSIKRIVMAADGESWTTVLTDGTPRTWHAPQRFPDDFETITRLLRADTSIALDEHQMRTSLPTEDWTKLRGLVDHDSSQWKPLRLTDVDWHEARARDAEDNGQWHAARFHLKALINLETASWQRQARLAHASVQLMDSSRAEQLYDSLQSNPDRLTRWYQRLANGSQIHRKWNTAEWYLTRLIERDPDDELAQTALAAVQENWPPAHNCNSPVGASERSFQSHPARRT